MTTPPLDPADEARVRRLLADARATGPMPSDVVDRLDDTLAELQRERSAGSAPGVPDVSVAPGAEGRPEGQVRRTPGAAEAPAAPTSLAAHRRRRVVGLLAAAAVVVVGGVTIGELVRDEPADLSSDSADRGEASAAEDGGARQQPSDGALDKEQAPSSAAKPGRTLLRRVATAVPTLRTDRLRADLLRVRRTVLPDDLDSALRSGTAGTVLVAPRGFSCPVPPAGRAGEGVLVGVAYDGEPALAAYRPPLGASQVVDVLPCGGGDPLRSLTLPAG